MTTKKDALKKSKLCVILNPEDILRLNLSLEEAVKQCITGGADMIQLRDKLSAQDAVLANAKKIVSITSKTGVIFLVNDDPVVAKESGADGVHLGQEDGPIEEARRLGGTDFIVGRSTRTLQQALQAVKEGADYIGYGPLFKTPVKPDEPDTGLEYVGEVSRRIRIPVFCIGGIGPGTIGRVIKSGGERIAIVRAALNNGRISDSVKLMKGYLK